MEADKFVTESYALWGGDEELVSPIDKQIDEMLSSFCCYPDFEWAKYDVRPPETHDLVGSWRDAVGGVFIFLLRQLNIKGQGKFDYLLLISGESKNVSDISELVVSLKGSMHHIEKKELKRKAYAQSLNEESKSKSIESFSKLVGIFTLFINAFSLYLRDLPPPSGMSKILTIVYEGVLYTLHLGSLLLLFLIVVLSIIYVIRYGYMLVGKMK
ncbi:TPA: hypothetical protein I7259_02385 [Vibrio parahaemolyticus]|nr:hypothetical protein [Vibrio parahaemolyticus]HCG5486989.1 hypothetical protein [Vibrio parahaemolyticus]HCH0842016.1 hypothetical protein [Vibrio parahaemolyticus]